MPRPDHRPTPALTICVPAYRPARFLPQLIDALAAQTLPDFNVMLSNDGGHDAAEVDRLCRPLGWQITHHVDRLGWIKNTNWLIRNLRSPFFAILPQDDLPRPEFYARMLGHLEAHPKAQAAFSALSMLGAAPVEGAIFEGLAHTGPKFQRLLDVLRLDWPGVSYRAVNRLGANQHRLLMLNNPHGELFADSTWILQQAALGQLIADPEPLFGKVFHDNNTHMKWEKLGPEAIVKAWRCHCAQIWAIAQAWAADADEARALNDAAINRAFTPPATASPWIADALSAHGLSRNEATIASFLDQAERWQARLRS